MNYRTILIFVLTISLLFCQSLNAQEQLPPSERFGVCTHIARWERTLKIDYLQTLRDAGFVSFRDGQEWDNIEKGKGNYVYSDVTKRIFNPDRKHNLQPLHVLAYQSPSGLYENELDPEAFANYAINTIAQFKGSGKHFELWNEPGNFFFHKQYGGTWNGKEKDNSDSPWVKKFAEFITLVAKRIKAKHPDVFLITGDNPAVNIRMLQHYPEMFENIDGIVVHPYPYSLPPEVTPWGGKNNKRDGVVVADETSSFKSLIQTLRQNLDDIGRKDMQIWITEVGYTTAQIKKKQLWLGFTPYAQACYNTRLGIQAVSYGVERTYYYDMLDDGSNKHHQENNFGLIYRNGQPKPAWLALTRMCRLMYGDTRPAPMNIEVNSPSERQYQIGVVWDDAKIQFINQPQTHSFIRPDAKRVVFVWKPGRIFADAQPDVANITITDCPWQLIEAGQLVSGQKVKLNIKQENSTLAITDAPYTEDPLYLVFQ
ncbi:MAG: hypothetical protein CMJ19_16340 [Phycisphaeraceae bacterium]|nr:hypothetical protein [Phycisphaeraceae bacterium]